MLFHIGTSVLQSSVIMMELKEAIGTRRSTRAFAKKKVEKEVVEELLLLASKAPSALNLQPWEVVVVAGEEKKRLSDVIGKAYSERSVPCGAGAVKRMPEEFYARQRRALAAMEPLMNEAGYRFDTFVNEGSCRFYDAPVAMLIFLDGSHSKGRMICIGVFLGYLLLAAHSLGLGAGPMTAFNPPDFSRILKLPAHLVPSVLVAVGYPAGDPSPKMRYPVSDSLI